MKVVADNSKTVLRNNVLQMNPAGLNKSYRTTVFITEGDGEITKLSYDIAVLCIEVFPSGGYLASVITTNFLVNGFEPDLMMEQLAYKCRKPLEKVVFLVGSNGSVEGIHNHIEIVDKWFDARVRLELEYTGENFRRYISLAEAALLDPATLLAALRKDIFISQYFYPLYWEPFFNYTKKNVEKVTFFNINYEIDMLLTLTENVSLAGNFGLTKTINRKEYDNLAMPVENYVSEYLLDEDLHILNIKGMFENYGRNYNFTIAEKYVGR
jgi:hypothetical protein